MNVATVSSYLFTVLRVVGSTIEGPHSMVLVGGNTGIGGLDESDTAPGEAVDGIAAYGAFGRVFRPRPPERIGKDLIGAEAFSARTPDGPTPLSWRDPRHHIAYPNPKVGSMADVGYAGGFADWEDVGAPAVGNPDLQVYNQRRTVYVPYAKNALGVPTKAHAIVFDPETESLSLIQGDGYAVVLDADNGIVMRSKTGASWIQLKDDKIDLVASSINARGNVALGANTAAALPLLPGPASQPTPSVYFSPV